MIDDSAGRPVIMFGVSILLILIVIIVMCNSRFGVMVIFMVDFDMKMYIYLLSGKQRMYVPDY